MKKLILTTFIVLALGSFAYAQMGMGRAGVHHNTKVVNVEEAKALVLQQTSNIKGVKVVSASEGHYHKGTMYIINVSDENGKTYEYHVNPWGEVILFK